MDNRKRIIAVSLILGIALILACAPKAAPAPAPQAAAPAPAAAAVPASAPSAAARPAWQENWEKTLAAAKKEGKLVIATTGGSEMRTVLIKGIKDAYGLGAEVIAGRPAEISVKVFAERRAGLYLEDIFVGHPNTSVNELKPAGAFESLDAALILPEVNDPKLWYRGDFPWLDKEHMVVGFDAFPGRPIAINTTLVKPEELKSWRDLLDPKWKGKLALNDPTTAGAGQQSMLAMDLIMGWDYVKELGKAEPIIMRDQRQQLEWLAHGKISILIAPKIDLFSEFLKVGAPIAIVEPVEGNWLTAGVGAVAVFNHTPNPNAARVFLNWLLSKDGQTLFSDAVLQQSRRLDVSSAAIPAELTRQAERKYVVVFDEPALQRYLVTSKMAKDVFGPLIK